MKKLLLIYYLLFASLNIFANKIDELKTDSDVIKFLLPLDKNFTGQYSRPMTMPSVETIVNNSKCDSLAKIWGIKNWDKVDFNHDDKTDLLAIVSWEGRYNNFIVLDNGNNSFKLIWINYSHFDECELINSVKINNSNLLVFHGINYIQSNTPRYHFDRIRRTDTLIYKFDDFIEYNSIKNDRAIDYITFSTGGCFGTCPTFKITVYSTGYAEYIAGTYSKMPGTFKTIIKKPALDQIFGLAGYLDTKKLKENYSVSWTDDATCTLTIKFADGTEKNISDYGERGTFGLRNLYSKFFALTGTVDWK